MKSFLQIETFYVFLDKVNIVGIGFCSHDLCLNVVLYVLTALFWWNPFIWLIRKQADAAIELSNDISLNNKADEREKADYASLLVKTAGLSSQADTIHSFSLAVGNS